MSLYVIFFTWEKIICNSAQTICLSRTVFMASSSCLEPRPLQDCHTMNDPVRRKYTVNKENVQFCQSWRYPDASTTCTLHCITFHNDGYSEYTVAGVENLNARVGCNPNTMVTSLKCACAYPLPWAIVHWLVQCTPECHWNATGWPSVYWDTTGRPNEYLHGTLEHHWKNLVEKAPHWNATT